MKYTDAFASLLRLDGLVVGGMSGGGLFVQMADGSARLVGILGAAVATSQTLAVAPYFHEKIWTEILRSLSEFGLPDRLKKGVNTFALKNQRVDRQNKFDKKVLIDSFLKTAHGTEALCQMNDAEMVHVINFKELASGELRFRLAVCLKHPDRNLVEKQFASLLSNPDADVRSRSLATIAKYKANDSIFVSMIIDSMLKDAESDVRVEAFHTLIRMGIRV